MKHANDKFNYIQPNKSNEKKIPIKEPVFLIRGQDLLGPLFEHKHIVWKLGRRKLEFAKSLIKTKGEYNFTPLNFKD